MGKYKGKKPKKILQNLGNSNVQMKRVTVPENTLTEASILVSHDSTEVTASELEVVRKEDASNETEKKTENSNHISGFIFMCNPSTKIDCYRYRVFGLPVGNKDVVERIKPGAKLFLYDFELKLLYGIYEATCCGRLHLEPTAFKGRFPAQVKFKILKECLPMPEMSLRNVIRENYTGSKFKQELSGNLVRKLTSTFRPLTASYSQPLPQALTLQPRVVSPSTIENQYNHMLMVPRRDVPYIPSFQYEQVPSVIGHQPGHSLTQHTQHRASYLEHAPQSLSHLPALSSCYAVANPQQTSTGHNVDLLLHNPTYSRTVEDTIHHHQISDLERKYLQMPSLGGAPTYSQNVAAYNSGATASSTHHYVPYNPAQPGLAVNSAPIQQSSHGSVPYHQLATLREPTQQDQLSAYYTHTYLQPHQVLTPGESQTSAPVSYYYYSYTGA